MPKVDVIIPAYNAARFLPMAIESVIAQTFDDWRIVLADDDSKDATPEIALFYKERLGDRLQYIRQERAGVSAARNNAIRQSTSDFLAMLDADDVWLPWRLEESLKVFEGRPQVGLAHGLVDRIDVEGKIIDTFSHPQRYSEGWIAPYIFMRKVDLPCLTVTVRRKCIENVGLFDESMRATEDRDLWLRIALRYQVALVPKVIAQYRVSSASATTDPEKMLQAQMRFIEKHYGSPGCGRRARRIALSWAHRQRAEALADNGKSRAALKNALRALAYAPGDARNIRTMISLLLRCLA
jgi:glycosyltransferase involved in cell wall biosynthesis